MQNCTDTELHPGRFWLDTFLHLLSYFCSLSNEFRNLAIFQASKPCKLNNLGSYRNICFDNWTKVRFWKKESVQIGNYLNTKRIQESVVARRTDIFFTMSAQFQLFILNVNFSLEFHGKRICKTTEQVINHVISVQMQHFLSCFLSLIFSLQLQHNELSIFQISLWPNFVFVKIW